MRYLLLYLIRVYWITIPARNRKGCIFSESCSRFVYRITLEKGTKEGLLALRTRYHQCRPGYAVVNKQDSGIIQICLADGTMISKKEMSDTFVSYFITSIENKIKHPPLITNHKCI